MKLLQRIAILIALSSSIPLLSSCTTEHINTPVNKYRDMEYSQLSAECYTRMDETFSQNEHGRCMKQLIESGNYTRNPIE